jgi:mannose-6-phosphate isomerase
VALTPFWMLAGFREPSEILQVLRARPELASLTTLLTALSSQPDTAAGTAAIVSQFYASVMRLPQSAVDELLSPLIARLGPAYDEGRLEITSPDLWAARAARQFSLPGGHHDRGILSIYLLNLVRLAPGEGTFLDAGILHAYLEGVVVEVMANSDNVIRGGLTTKHVDVDELLRILAFTPGAPARLAMAPTGYGEQHIATPAAEFALSRFDFDDARRAGPRTASGPEVLIVIDGNASIAWPTGSLTLGRGRAVLIPAGLEYVPGGSPSALIFRALVPDDQPASTAASPM